MHILLYVPDNEVSNNFIPQLWPYVLKRLTPPEHRVTIIDGNALHHNEEQLVDFVRENQVDLVGMGFMTRMAQRAYNMAAAIRKAAGPPIVMGGPHVTAIPHEPLGLAGYPQCADAVVVGEADALWPRVVEDAARGQLRQIYEPSVFAGMEAKPSLVDYPIIPWDKMDLAGFNLMRFVPPFIAKMFKKSGIPFDKAYVIPMESGRGCPYGCEFCTVTGFFGDEIRFREDANIIEELRQLKALAKRDNALLMVFFIDDNFAIHPKRTKALLREMIRQDVCLPWIGQASMNLLKDEELVQLFAASGCYWLFLGLESVEKGSLKQANKGFNKPEQYTAVLDLLAKYNLYAITSFIYGMESDQPEIWKKTIREIQKWPPGLPVFGLLTPYPATPLYERLQSEGRLSRPRHWLDFQAFKIAFEPRNLSPDQAEAEVHESWRHCYAPVAFYRAQRWLLKHQKGFGPQFMHFISRLFFRGIYFRQMSRWAWIRLLARNLPALAILCWSGWRSYRQLRSPRPIQQAAPDAGPK